MANIKSAKKRIKVINRQRAENRLVKTTIATYTKKFRALVANGELVEAEAKLKETISLLDSAASKGVLHKNNASRKISRLTSALAKAKGEVKPAEVKKSVEVVEEPKKVEVEKEVAKKPATKKATTAKKEVKAEEVEVKKTTRKTTTKKAETTEVKKPATKKAVKKEEAPAEKPAKKTASKKTAKAE